MKDEGARRFKPYPAYKDSGVEWLGEIPEGWEALKLKRVCTFAYGDALASDARADGETEVYGSNGPVGLHDQANTLAPCLIIGRKGSFGKINYAERPVFAIDTTFFVDRRSSRSDLRWLYYALTDARLDSATKDSAIPGLDRGDAYSREICLPPESEQRAIAAFLDRETARIDVLVAKKERLIELLQEERSAVVTAVVTGKFEVVRDGGNDKENDKEEGGRRKDEHGDSSFRLQPSSVPMKDSGVEWLGEIPAHWAVKRLWHLTPTHRRIMYGIVLPGPNVDEGVPVVKGGDVSPDRLRLDRLNRTSREIESAYVRSRLRGGDLVYAIRGSIGEVAMVPHELTGANITQDAARIAHTSETDGAWLLYALKSKAAFAQLEAGALGATIRGVNIRDLKRASLAVPPSDEQRAIARYLDLETARLDTLIAKVREAIDRLKELRTALVSAAVTGKIDVREESAP